jgi:hypothetical protein
MTLDTLLFFEESSEIVPWLARMNISLTKIPSGYCLDCSMDSIEAYYVWVVAHVERKGKRKGRVSLMIPHGSVKLMARPNKVKKLGFLLDTKS